MMLQGHAGPALVGDGVDLDIRLGRNGDQICSDLHGQYYEQAVRKQIFFNTTLARALSLGATAMVGNIVWNPPSSGVNLVMLTWSGAVIATSATLTGIALAAQYQATLPTGITASDAVGQTLLDYTGVLPQGKAKGYAIATLVTAPVPVEVLAHNTAAINTVGVDQMGGDFKGKWIIPPGGVVCLAALGAAAAASGFSSTLTWEEVPAFV